MFAQEYKNYYIDSSYSFTGKTQYYKVWKMDEDNMPYDVWGESFRSIKQARSFIDMEVENDALLGSV